MTTLLVRTKRRLGRIPRAVLAAVLAGLAVLSAVAATISWGVASARDDTVVGAPVSEKQMTAIVAAARSCPVLTPARIAGQLMAESGLNNKARETASGGQGIAGLDDDDWKRWKPWPDAQRADSSANILALAHQMCDLSGQLRLAGVVDDQWRLAVAAFHAGLSPVVETKGVPADAVEYVDLVSGYAGYYERLRQFGEPGTPAPTASPADGSKNIPAQYVPLVVEAGSVCEQVTPPMVAAQLMALSGFDPNMLGPTGQRGIAQFLPELWQAYGPEGGSARDRRRGDPDRRARDVRHDRGAVQAGRRPVPAGARRLPQRPDRVRETGGTFDQGPRRPSGGQGPDRPVRARQPAAQARGDHTTRDAVDAAVDPVRSGTDPRPEHETAPPPPPPVTTAPTPAKPKAPARPAGAKQIFHPMTGLCVSSGSRG